MNSKFFRSRVAAVMLGMASVSSLALVTATPVQAAVRAVVGKPLQEAQRLAGAGNYSAAMAKVNEAAGAGGLTPEESHVIAQMKAYISSKSGATSGGGKLANDYRAGRWSAVIADGNESGLNATDMAAVATAYYKLGRNADCVRYIKTHLGNGASDLVLKIQMACAFGAGDDDSQTSALEQLVSRSQSPEYWGQLLKSAQRTRGLRDPQSIDIYRLKLRTGSLTTADEYLTLSKLALAGGFAAEAAAVEQKGIDAKVLTGDSVNRLMAMTKAQMAGDKAGTPQALAAAQKAPTGDALVKLGEDLWGMGKFPDAISAIQAGIAKDKTDVDLANTRLGMAYLGAGQKDAALRAFGKAAKGSNPNQAMIARLWTLYARK
jgi:tetratricopeptide (TPR) repeat protein